MNFTKVEAAVLHRIQKGIPALAEPYRHIGESVGLNEDDVIKTINDLKDRNIIRNISGIFNGEALGYVLNLIAFKVPQDRIDTAVQVINSHPGVSHNYLRGHDYNIWFTLAEDSEENFHKSLSVIAEKSGALDYLVLKNEKLLKIGVMLDVGKDTGKKFKVHAAGNSENGFAPLTSGEIEAVKMFQMDLPVCPSPYEKILRDSGSSFTTEDLMKFFTKFTENNIMRRYAAVLNHRNAGYTANAMTAWKTGEDFDPDLFIQNSAVSHLYLRTLYPGRWEYPLFAMAHAKSDDELNRIVAELSDRSGIKDYIVLESLKEFKKKRVTYFSDKFIEWKRMNYD